MKSTHGVAVALATLALAGFGTKVLIDRMDASERERRQRTTETIQAASAAIQKLSAPKVSGVPPAVEQTLRGYWSSENCMSRLRFIISPQANEPTIREYYSNKNQIECKGTISSITGTPPSSCETVAIGDHCFVGVTLGDEQTLREYELRRTGPSSFLIDWRSSAGFNPMTFAAFRARRPTSPVLFRVWAKLHDYYNYDWRGLENTHYSLSVREPFEQVSIYSYVPKKGNEALVETLKDGKEHTIMVYMQHRTNSPGEMTDGRVHQLHWRESAVELDQITK